jgi:hypothetical protein
MASGKSDTLKGRVKEAAGALTGDKKLKREGKADQAVGNRSSPPSHLGVPVVPVVCKGT